MNDKIIIYTDGSADNAGDRTGGIGVVLSYKGKVIEKSEGYRDTTNQRMEMLACIRGLQAIKKGNKIPVELYSDSAYVVNCFKDEWYVNWRKNGWRNSKKAPVENKDLWVELIGLYEELGNVTVNKVKGHADVELNERADVLAHEGRMTVK